MDRGLFDVFCLKLVRIVALTVLIGIAGTSNLQAQKLQSEADSLQNADSALLLMNEPRKVGFWLAGFSEPSYAKEIPGLNFGAGASVVYMERFYAGFYGVVFLGNYESRLIFPNRFSFNYSHAGLWAGYKTRMDRNFQFTADLKTGEGKIFWERNDNHYNMFEDYALFFIPSVGVDLELLKFLALHGAVGYRSVHGLDIPQFSNADFSGINVLFMIKVGLF